MILHAVGGLCNRLRAILSRPRPLTVRWDRDEYVDFSGFEDVFQPLEGVTFCEGGAFDEEAWAPPAGASADWNPALLELRLRPHVEADLLSILEGGPYAAVHIRRTDHTPLAASAGIVNPDVGFERFVAALPPTMDVYVATDNRETQRHWIRALDGRAIIARTVVRESFAVQRADDHRRHTSLTHAAIDLFACVGAASFMGSNYSTFTETIEDLRRLRA